MWIAVARSVLFFSAAPPLPKSFRPMAMYTSRPRPVEAPKPTKAYKNEDFLNGPMARLLRIQCEIEEPRVRLDAHGIENIVMIFGSARSKSPEEYKKYMAELREKVKTDPSVKKQLSRAERMDFLCRYHDETVELSRLITEFSQQRSKRGLPTYTVGTGAGPGMMEAANEGAWKQGGRSVGFGISLPFETGLNPYVTPELGFEFHYFFTRKFWMAYKCMGLVVAPGGYGTCDELFEILTLIQTEKIKLELPIILFGREYWTQVLQFDVLEEFGLIDQKASKMVFICDTAVDAFARLKQFWLDQESNGVPMSPTKKPANTGIYSVEEPPVKKLKLDQAGELERPMPPKAYKNFDFIKSNHCRVFRIQCEMEETRHRLDAHGIQNTVMFCGSGDVKSMEKHLSAFAALASDPDQHKQELERLTKMQPLLKYHQVSRDLARRLTAWSMHRAQSGRPAYHVATGGGMGLTQSANEGAWEAGGQSIAFNGGVLSHRQINPYVTPELAFVFHYFFTRKFWMAYKCMGVVALPGGFGTCDELFELLTLMQTGKIKRKMPIVLIGKDFWNRSIQWQKMADYGMISDDDVAQLLFTDCAEEAFQHITKFWESAESDGRMPSPRKAAKKQK